MRLPDEKKMTEPEVKKRLKDLYMRFEGPRGLHEKVRHNTLHMFRDPSVDPMMPGSSKQANGLIEGPWQSAASQTTWVQNVFFKWKSRVTENAWLVEGKPQRDTIPNKALANNAETLLVQGFEFIRERTGIDIQSNLCDAKAFKAAGVLHWRIDDSRYAENMPDYEEWDEPPNDPDMEVEDKEAQAVADQYKGRASEQGVAQKKAKKKVSRYTADPYDEGILEDETENYVEETADGPFPYTHKTGKKVQRKLKKKYRETADSLAERIARYKAECGFPVFVDTIPIEQCAWTQDKSTFSEFKEFAVKTSIPVLGDWKDAKLKDVILRERASPKQEVMGTEIMLTPDAQDYEKTAVVYQYWTRRYWYEWCESGDGGAFGEGYFDCGEHPYAMPPFAIDIGRYVDVDSPALAYQPVFGAMLEEKPIYDRIKSIVDAAVEESSILKWILQPNGQVIPGLNQDGSDPIDMAADSGAATKVPPGYKLEGVGGTGVNQQLFKILERSEARMQAAEPSTGFATFGATTQPTAAWQEQAQENMEPKMHIRNTARTLQAMVNNLIRVFADPENGPGEVFGYAKSKGKLDRTKVLSLKPEDWANIIADVRIVEVGNVERAALEQLGMQKAKDGYITPIELIGDYEGKPNPEQIYVERESFKAWETTIKPAEIRSEMARVWPDVILTPGLLPTINGQSVTDEQAIQSQGGTPQAAPPQGPPVQGMGAGVQQAAQNVVNAGPSTMASGVPVGAQAMGAVR